MGLTEVAVLQQESIGGADINSDDGRIGPMFNDLVTLTKTFDIHLKII